MYGDQWTLAVKEVIWVLESIQVKYGNTPIVIYEECKGSYFELRGIEFEEELRAVKIVIGDDLGDLNV